MVSFFGHAAEEGWVVAVFISTLKFMSGEFELINFCPYCVIACNFGSSKQFHWHTLLTMKDLSNGFFLD